MGKLAPQGARAYVEATWQQQIESAWKRGGAVHGALRPTTLCRADSVERTRGVWEPRVRAEEDRRRLVAEARAMEAAEARAQAARAAEGRRLQELGRRVADLTQLDPGDAWALGVAWEALRRVSGSEDEDDLAVLVRECAAAGDRIDLYEPTYAERWYRATYVCAA